METVTTQPMILALAEMLREKLPEFEGRVLAVSTVIVDGETLPTLPVVMIAHDLTRPKPNTAPREPFLVESFTIEFWFEPKRYTQNGLQTPYWVFVDHTIWLRKLLSLTTNWISPQGGRLTFVSIVSDANNAIASLSFKFTHEYKHCDLDEYDPCAGPETIDDGLPFEIAFVMRERKDCCEPECFEPVNQSQHECLKVRED